MKWEYKIEQILSTDLTSTGLPNQVNERLNVFGKEGWELVGTESIVKSGLLGGVATVVIVSFFKRPIA